MNRAAHVTADGLDRSILAQTVKTAMRMLDNAVDINFYTIPEARASNLRHRPVGLGLMGLQDALQALRIAYASEQAVAFADTGRPRRAAGRGAELRAHVRDVGMRNSNTMAIAPMSRIGQTGTAKQAMANFTRVERLVARASLTES